MSVPSRTLPARKPSGESEEYLNSGAAMLYPLHDLGRHLRSSTVAASGPMRLRGAEKVIAVTISRDDRLPPGATRAQIQEGLRPLLELPVEHVLATHGGPFDRAALERALSPA